MKSKQRGEATEVFYLFLCLLIIAFAVFAGYERTVTKNACLRAGYPEAWVTPSLDKYCIKRVDQSDVVTPLEQIK